MTAEIEGYVHSVETAGTVDGPGLRFVLFLTGCPLRCLYCHNPDTRHMKDGKLRKASELVAEASRYADFMHKTGGGITISGGEPLMQQDFVTEIFKGCKAAGLHTTLDTSGCFGKNVASELLDVTDLFLLDIKSFDAATYQKVTSGKLEQALDFARLLAEKGKKMWVRCVLVPEVTDDPKAFEALADFLAELGNVERVEILPFHKMGEEKWKELGYDYKLEQTQPPSPEQTDLVRGIFKKRGFDTV